MEPEDQNQTEERPAITIQIQAWTTPIVLVIALVIGLCGGYFGRPIVEGRFAPTATATATATRPPTVTAPPAATNTTGSQVPTPNTQLMTTVMAEVRHFRGNPDAAVTIIEFSDFQ